MRKLFMPGFALVLFSCQPAHHCPQVAESGGNGTLTGFSGKKKDVAFIASRLALPGDPVLTPNPKKKYPASGGSGSTTIGTIHQKKRDVTMPTALHSATTHLLNICNHG